MVDINVSSLTIGGRSYNKDKSGYPALPTIFSGVEVVWGAASCIDHPEPSRCTISLWVPKTHESFIPALGEVVVVDAADLMKYGYNVRIFTGKVESVKIQDDHKANGGYRINMVAADALAEAARLRLADSIWPYETVPDRLRRIANLASINGVAFDGFLRAEMNAQAASTYVRARDVDSFPALEAFQRTAMAAGFPIESVRNEVCPARVMELPQILAGNQPASGTVYSWNVTGAGSNEMKVNGVLTRTNWASNPSGTFYGYSSLANYSIVLGTGGDGNVVPDTSSPKYGGYTISATWGVPATGGTQGVKYRQSGITGASASKVSAGMWVRSNVAKTVKLAVDLFAGATAAGSGLSANYNLAANTWTWIKFDNVSASVAYDTVEVMVQAQSNMLAGQKLVVDGVLIEKAATSGAFFDQYSLDPAASVIGEARTGVVTFDASAIEDDVFELDTSKVVNEIKVEMKRFIGSAGEPGWEAKDSANQDFDQIFTDEAGSRKTTPQTRNIATDWAIRDAYLAAELPTSIMVTKGMLLLSGQSKAQWRMSGPLTPVLSLIPNTESFQNYLQEGDRFGSLIRIGNAPSFLPEYMRVRGGRIVLGDNPTIEMELEPVEYSAPVPLTGSTLKADVVASNFKLRNFKTLTANDLRSIGAR